jgi:hypothetical protein
MPMKFAEFFALVVQFLEPKFWEKIVEAMRQDHGDQMGEFQKFVAMSFFWGGPEKVELMYAEIRAQGKPGFWAVAIQQLMAWEVKVPDDIKILAQPAPAAPPVAEPVADEAAGEPK